ncbi:MAG: hypothetical protein U1A77_02310 [Pirellulales bacterium]
MRLYGRTRPQTPAPASRPFHALLSTAMPFDADHDADIQLIAATSSSADAFVATLERRVGERLLGQRPTILGPLDLNVDAESAVRRARLAVILVPTRNASSAPADFLPQTIVRQIESFTASLPISERDPDSIRGRLFLVLFSDDAETHLQLGSEPELSEHQANQLRVPLLLDAESDALREAIRGLTAFDLRTSEPPPAPLNFEPIALEQLTSAVARRLVELRHGDSPRVRRPTVFLAEPASDVAIAAQMLRSYLEDHGYRVAPQERHSQATPGSLERFASELADARLFVQLLGSPAPLPSPFSPDSPLFPGGYECWQHNQAVSAGLPILRWRAPQDAIANWSIPGTLSASATTSATKDTGANKNSDASEDVEVNDVGDIGEASKGAIVCDFERFRTLVIDELRKARTASTRAASYGVASPAEKASPPANSLAEAVVLIVAAPCDEAWGESLREQIRDWTVEMAANSTSTPQTLPSLTDSSNSSRVRSAPKLIHRFIPKMVLGNLSLEREARRYTQFRGAIVVHAAGDDEWLQRQLLACRRLSLEQSRTRPGFALWSVNAATSDNRWLPPCVQRLAHSDPQALTAFLQLLAESRT